MIKIGKSASNISVYTCQPQNKEDLKEIILDRIKKEGPDCDLNDIDTSLIDDMSNLFSNSNFTGDISKWNTSNIISMSCMFACSSFDGDISNWNVSNVTIMDNMFAYSKFNQDISNWNVSNVLMMKWMFNFSKFNHDISKWKINKDCNTYATFNGCLIRKEFRPKILQL